MANRFLMGLGCVLAPAVASGQDACPDGASTEIGYVAGEPVRLLALRSDDPAAAEHAGDVGAAGVVDHALQRVEGCWFQGSFTAPDGRILDLTRAAVGRAPKPKPGPCPEGALRTPPPFGTPVRIVALHPADAFYASRSELIGLTGYSAPHPIETEQGCWFSADVVTSVGTRFYFFRVALSRVGDRDAPHMWFGAAVPKGRRFDIVGVHDVDAYGAIRDRLIGQQCEALDVMPALDRGWFMGPAACDDGKTYQFYRVAVGLPDEGPYTARMGVGLVWPEDPAGCPEGVEYELPRARTHVRIVGVGPEDGRTPEVAAPFIGLGATTHSLERSGACWVRGPLELDDGRTVHFRQAGLALDEAVPCPEAADLHLPYSDDRRLVELVGLHPDDAHAAEAASLVGSTFIATEPLWSIGACWYSGPVRAEDGTRYFFWKAAFRDPAGDADTP